MQKNHEKNSRKKIKMKFLNGEKIEIISTKKMS
jgi:hypothetical protein